MHQDYLLGNRAKTKSLFVKMCGEYGTVEFLWILILEGMHSKTGGCVQLRERRFRRLLCTKCVWYEGNFWTNSKHNSYISYPLFRFLLKQQCVSSFRIGIEWGSWSAVGGFKPENSMTKLHYLIRLTTCWPNSLVDNSLSNMKDTRILIDRPRERILKSF